MIREMVLYYAPQPMPYVSKLKGVLVRMGVRIKNISPDQTGQKVGHLAGMPGFEAESETGEILPIKEEMLVMKNFTSRRVDDLRGAKDCVKGCHHRAEQSMDFLRAVWRAEKRACCHDRKPYKTER